MLQAFQLRLHNDTVLCPKTKRGEAKATWLSDASPLDALNFPLTLLGKCGAKPLIGIGDMCSRMQTDLRI